MNEKGVLLEHTIPGTPTPKARARRNSRTGHWWTPSSEAEHTLAMELLQYRRWFTHHQVKVTLEFHMPRSSRAADIDNLAKLVLDACTKTQVFPDDRQVHALAVKLERDSDSPRTVLRIEAIKQEEEAA